MKIYKTSAKDDVLFAKTSSQIEGEFSDIAIVDSLNAWVYMKRQKELTAETLLDCHKVLQHQIRPDIAGKFRTRAVYIGGHEAPKYIKIKDMLDGWLKKYGNASSFRKKYTYKDVSTLETMLIKDIKQAHLEFEHIHPFEDGNGRVGRCIMNWHLIMNNLPLIIIRPGREQQEYYKWFRQ